MPLLSHDAHQTQLGLTEGKGDDASTKGKSDDASTEGKNDLTN